MVKKYGLLYAVKYYSIIPFAVLALVLYIANPFIFAYTCNALKITERSGFYMPFKLLIAVALFASVCSKFAILASYTDLATPPSSARVFCLLI